MIFQPLLHDPLGWKPSKSTYVDHYKWKKYRTTSKDRKISTYGQQYQRQLQKQQANKSLPLTTNGEQTISRVILVKKPEDQQDEQQQQQPISYRFSPSKTPVYIVEYKKRPVSANAVRETKKKKEFSIRFLKNHLSFKGCNFYFKRITTSTNCVTTSTRYIHFFV